MRVIADLHIHSRYSRATSLKMKLGEITRFAQMKGLDLLGTGDFTHPEWFRELRRDLEEAPERGLYIPKKASIKILYYMITGEVSTIFTYEGEVRKIHHVILTESFETALQINDRLEKYGNLKSDGRPTLSISAPQLVEEVMDVSGENMVIPSHIWTPWFSLFGAFSGFDRIEDCYQDQTRNIFALETGLSSDPPMNWRLSRLDRYTLVSNSDSHSPWPWRIGREANIFELDELSYNNIIEALKRRRPNRITMTVETDPSYGKYHWTGHRRCGVSLSPEAATKSAGICPVCRGRLTKGVSQRVEELADRPPNFTLPEAHGYLHLLPLSEIIQKVKGLSSPSLRRIWEIYTKLIQTFGNEYKVLLEPSVKDLMKASDPDVAWAIVSVREGRVKVTPGYDGVYGEINLSGRNEKNSSPHKRKYTLDEYLFQM